MMKRNTIKFIYSFLFLLTSTIVMSQTTITKTYSGPTVSVDDDTASIPITFNAADFPNGFVIENVSVSITWTKTDGTCASPDPNEAYHNEIGFELQGPGGIVELAFPEIGGAPGTWSGNVNIDDVTTIFDDSFVTMPSGTPVSGNFSPSESLSLFNGADPRATWNLIGIDNVGSDPLCIESYSITITTTDTGTTCGNVTLLNESPTNAFVGPAASCANSTSGDPTSNTFEYHDIDTSCYDGVDVAVTIIPDNPNGTGTPGFEAGDYVEITLTDDNGSSTTTIDGATYNGGNSNTFTATRINPGANLNIDVFIQITGNSNATGGGGCWERLRVTNVVVTGSDSTPPPAPTIADETFDCSATPTAPTTIDTCNSTTITGTTSTVFPITASGTTVVAWTFTDSCNNSVTVNQNIIINECVDLSLTKRVDNALPKVGSQITFTLRLTNSGSATASGIEVEDKLPSGLTYLNHSAPGASTYVEADGIWYLNTETLINGAFLELTITATVTGAGAITNTAKVIKVDQTDVDSDPTN